MLSLFQCVVLASLPTTRCPYACRLFSVFSSFPLINMSVFMPVACFSYYCSSVVQFEIGSKTSSSFLLLRSVWSILVLCFHMKFMVVLWNLVELCWYLMQIELNVRIAFGRMVIFAVPWTEEQKKKTFCHKGLLCCCCVWFLPFFNWNFLNFIFSSVVATLIETAR